MRPTFNHIEYTHEMPQTGAPQVPNRIIVHRHAGRNGGERSVPTLNYLKNAGLGIHEDIDLNGDVYHAAHWVQAAKHCLEARTAAKAGRRVNGPLGTRGDYDAIGIECVDIDVDGVRRLPRETRISLVLVCAKICRERGLDPLGKFAVGHVIDEHATWDEWNRPQDLGDALNIPDLRDDVRDFMDGREPWRTVGPVATGERAPASWKPATRKPPEVHLIRRGGEGYPIGELKWSHGTPTHDYWVREVDKGVFGKDDIIVGVPK